MDRKRGVRERGHSIQIDFYYLGKRCRESLRLEPTKPNLSYARRLKEVIQHEIAVGTFSYSKHFPNSKNAHLGTRAGNKIIGEALDDYIEAARRTCQPSTGKNYLSAVNFHLKPAFGDIRLVDLTTATVKSWIGGLTISNKRINNVLIPLRTVFNDAFADGLIDRNPLLRISNLSVKFDEPQPFSPKEVEAILQELPAQGKNLVQFAFWTGLRTSELIGLEWSDIDWHAGLVRVRRAVVARHSKQPKTKAGERDVKLLPPALDALNAQKPFSMMASQRIFLNPQNNKPWETDAQIRQRLWKPALKRAGVIYRNPYQTRHTYASTLLSAGENPMWVALQMGHKDWGMIRKRYGRWIPNVDDSAGSKVMRFWSQIGHRSNASA